MEQDGGLLDTMTDYQLFRWMVYARNSPIGEERADLRAGIIAATVANTIQSAAMAWSGKAREFKPSHPMDFMPYTKKPDRSTTRIKSLAEEQTDWIIFSTMVKAQARSRNRQPVVVVRR